MRRSMQISPRVSGEQRVSSGHAVTTVLHGPYMVTSNIRQRPPQDLLTHVSS